jgi:hypothetical protein
MTANSKDENPSSETRKLDPTLIAKPLLKEGGGSYGSGVSSGGAPVGNVGGAPVGNVGGAPVGNVGGAPVGNVGGAPVGNVGGAPVGNVGGAPVGNVGGAPVGNVGGVGSTNSGGVRIQGGGSPITSSGNDDLPIRRSNSIPSGSSSTAQPKKPQQSQTRPTTTSTTQVQPSQKPRTSSTDNFNSQPRPQTPKKSPKPKYPDSIDSIPAATNSPDRAVNDRARRSVNQQLPQTDFDPHNKPVKPSSPVKITQPKPKEYEPLPSIPPGDPRTTFPTTTPSNPDRPLRNRRNPKKPDILRVKNRPEVDRFLRDNPLVPAQKPNPSVLPGKITPPSNGGQAVQAKKTPNNGGSQNSNSGGKQQPTKKQKKALAKKYAGKDVDKLTPAEEKEFKQGYIISNDKGKKYIKRKSEADDYPPLHLAEVNGKRVIAEGKSPNARGNSNAATMKREFKAKFGEDVPQGDDLHHLIPVNVWQKDPIVQALEKKGEKEEVPVAGVDDGNGLLSLPSNSDAMKKPSKNLEQKGGRVKIAHPSSHTKWDEHVKDLLEKERIELKKFGSLDKVPINELEKSIDNVRNQLRKDLQRAERKLEQGNYIPPKWIDPKYPLKPEPSKSPTTPLRNPKLYPRIVQEPTKKDVSEFRQVLAALKEKANPSPQKHLLFDDRHNLNPAEKQARTLGYSAILAVKENNYSYGEQFVFQHKGAEVGIYRQGDYTQVAVVDLKKGDISMNKPLNETEHSWLVEKQNIMLTQASEKQQDHSQKGRGFEMI